MQMQSTHPQLSKSHFYDYTRIFETLGLSGIYFNTTNRIRTCPQQAIYLKYTLLQMKTVKV